ncbi:hypothetical protein LR48_Vigan511s000300 [Vigna angularis]|uniref:Uncharacterized protein n=1 Tax=Phaseolus angularis TaxID=3914 RepID=A0A0L9TC33_PHAAN|nr:hypothetical protein LR48_Vigan511s000300 [Vigna angularis]
MAEAPHSSRDEVPTSRPTRGAMRLRQLILRRNAGERTPIIIYVVTRVASGPNADVFRSYLGVLARDRISILTPSFDHVSEADQNLIWQDLLTDQEGSPTMKKTGSSEDDPLGALDELCNMIADTPMIVHGILLHLEEMLRSHYTCISKMLGSLRRGKKKLILHSFSYG